MEKNEEFDNYQLVWYSFATNNDLKVGWICMVENKKNVSWLYSILFIATAANFNIFAE